MCRIGIDMSLNDAEVLAYAVPSRKDVEVHFKGVFFYKVNDCGSISCRESLWRPPKGHVHRS